MQSRHAGAGQASPSTENAARLTLNAPGISTGTMLGSPIFWLMFVMMALMGTSGLMVISQMAAFAGEFGITKATV